MNLRTCIMLVTKITLLVCHARGATTQQQFYLAQVGDKKSQDSLKQIADLQKTIVECKNLIARGEDELRQLDEESYLSPEQVVECDTSIYLSELTVIHAKKDIKNLMEKTLKENDPDISVMEKEIDEYRQGAKTLRDIISKMRANSTGEAIFLRYMSFLNQDISKLNMRKEQLEKIRKDALSAIFKTTDKNLELRPNDGIARLQYETATRISQIERRIALFQNEILLAKKSIQICAKIAQKHAANSSKLSQATVIIREITMINVEALLDYERAVNNLQRELDSIDFQTRKLKVFSQEGGFHEPTMDPRTQKDINELSRSPRMRLIQALARIGFAKQTIAENNEIIRTLEETLKSEKPLTHLETFLTNDHLALMHETNNNLRLTISRFEQKFKKLEKVAEATAIIQRCQISIRRRRDALSRQAQMYEEGKLSPTDSEATEKKQAYLREISDYKQQIRMKQDYIDSAMGNNPRRYVMGEQNIEPLTSIPQPVFENPFSQLTHASKPAVTAVTRPTLPVVTTSQDPEKETRVNEIFAKKSECDKKIATAQRLLDITNQRLENDRIDPGKNASWNVWKNGYEKVIKQHETTLANLALERESLSAEIARITNE